MRIWNEVKSCATVFGLALVGHCPGLLLAGCGLEVVWRRVGVGAAVHLSSLCTGQSTSSDAGAALTAEGKQVQLGPVGMMATCLWLLFCSDWQNYLVQNAAGQAGLHLLHKQSA